MCVRESVCVCVGEVGSHVITVSLLDVNGETSGGREIVCARARVRKRRSVCVCVCVCWVSLDSRYHCSS